jgi:hypothetical protein
MLVGPDIYGGKDILLSDGSGSLPDKSEIAVGPRQHSNSWSDSSEIFPDVSEIAACLREPNKYGRWEKKWG